MKLCSQLAAVRRILIENTPFLVLEMDNGWLENNDFRLKNVILRLKKTANHFNLDHQTFYSGVTLSHNPFSQESLFLSKNFKFSVEMTFSK